MKVHYGVDAPHCKTPSLFKLDLTTDRRKVTCLKCEAGRVCRQCKHRFPLSEFAPYVVDGENRRRTTCRTCRKAPDSYGDASFKGLGKLRCKWCGRPLVDVPLPGPCPCLRGDAA